MYVLNLTPAIEQPVNFIIHCKLPILKGKVL